jgi:transcriptional regulator with XRE-family HTH domain
MTITPEQCKAARKLLGWSLSKLAVAAGLNLAKVSRFEQGGAAHPDDNAATWIEKAIREAFGQAGVEFIAQNGGGPGVRLREPR